MLYAVKLSIGGPRFASPSYHQKDWQLSSWVLPLLVRREMQSAYGETVRRKITLVVRRTTLSHSLTGYLTKECTDAFSPIYDATVDPV